MRAVMVMNKLDQYIYAATRNNTRRTYQSAIRHFEVEWGCFLPATADGVARYLVDQAELLSINTLRQRLAALAHSKIESAKKLLASGVPPKDVAKNLGVSVATLYRWVPASTNA